MILATHDTQMNINEVINRQSSKMQISLSTLKKNHFNSIIIIIIIHIFIKRTYLTKNCNSRRMQSHINYIYTHT